MLKKCKYIYYVYMFSLLALIRLAEVIRPPAKEKVFRARFGGSQLIGLLTARLTELSS